MLVLLMSAVYDFYHKVRTIFLVLDQQAVEVVCPILLISNGHVTMPSRVCFEIIDFGGTNNADLAWRGINYSSRTGVNLA